MTSLLTLSGCRGRRSTTHLGHVLGDYKQAAVLLHDHAEQLHQVIVSELPEAGEKHGHVSFSPSECSKTQRGKLPYVMTEASAMKACAVASFLIHFTATLVPL